MNKVSVILLFSKEIEFEKKQLVENVLIKNNVNFEIKEYSLLNYFKVDDKIKMQDLYNLSLKQEAKTSDGVIILNCDYTNNEIQTRLNDIISNLDADIVNFKKKRNKFFAFLHKIKFLIYNLVLSVFNISGLQDVCGDFMFLGKNALKVIKNSTKSPNYIRNFNNFTGYNIKTIEADLEKRKTSQSLYLVFAIISLVLAIISFDFLLLVVFKYREYNYTIKLSLVGIILTTIYSILSIIAFAYNKYKKSI